MRTVLQLKAFLNNFNDNGDAELAIVCFFGTNCNCTDHTHIGKEISPVVKKASNKIIDANLTDTTTLEKKIIDANLTDTTTLEKKKRKKNPNHSKIMKKIWAKRKREAKK